MKGWQFLGLRKILAIFLKNVFSPKSDWNWDSMKPTGLNKDKKEKLDQVGAKMPDFRT